MAAQHPPSIGASENAPFVSRPQGSYDYEMKRSIAMQHAVQSTNRARQKIPLRRSGRSATGSPFTESMWFTIAVPGRIPLQSKRFSLVDVPDLRTLAELWPQATDVWMGAGPVPVPLHWALTGFAWLVRIRLLPNLSWMAGAMHFVTNHVRWGQHRGGMFVEVAGRSANGESVVREWHLLAEGDDGPLIPCMAVDAVIRKALAGGCTCCDL
jgi:hypothetical protein